MKKTTVVLLRTAMLAVGVSLPFTARPAITSIPCNAADYTCQPSGANNPIASTTDAIGFAGSPGSSWCAILMFPLPTLPAGKTVGPQTTMTITLASVGASTTINGDLWGVANFRTALPGSTPDSTYGYYLVNNTGPGNNSTATDVKLVDNFLTPVLIPQAGNTVSTPTGTTNNLQAYIQSFYSNNPSYNASVSQAYVWLRINSDSASSSTANRYVINAGDSSVAAALKPTLNLDVADIPTNTVVWNGNVSPDWDTTTANWKSNSITGFTYLDGDDVVFNDTLAANPVVALNTTVLPNSVSVFGTTTAYAIGGTGKISGAASLVKLGTNTLILDTDNDYTGGTTLAGGILQVGNNDTHGSVGTGPITNTVNGSILQFNRTDSTSVNNVTRNSSYNATVVVNSGTVNLGGTGDNSGTLAFVRNGGTLVLAKSSSGTAHTLGSSSTINAGGTMRLGGSGGDQIFQNAFITNNGVFDLAGLSEGMNGMAGNGQVTNSAGGSSTLQLGDGGGTTTFAGPIVAGAGITTVAKTGAGTQTLTGTNTYTGATYVNAGKLVVTTAGGAPGIYGVSNTATLGVLVSTTNSALNVSNLTVGTGKVEFSNYATATVAPLHVGNLVVNGTLTISIASSFTSLLPNQSYPLIAYTSLSGGGNFALGTLPAGVSGSLDTSSSPIKFVVSTVPVTWNGNVAGGVWDIGTTPNWKFGNQTGLTYPDGDLVTFDDTLSGTSTVNVTMGVSPLSVLFTNNTHAYMLTGPGYLSGPVMLVKTGTNTLIVDTDNDYLGGTILAGGTLQVGNGDMHGNLGFGPLTNLVGGSILAFNRTDTLSMNTITRTTVDNSARVVINSGIVSLEGNGDNAGTLATVNNGATLYLNKSSSSIVHALSGALLINPGGVMQVGGFGGDQIYTASILTDNGTFDLNGNNEGFDGLLGNGIVTVLGGGGSSTLQLGENNGSFTFNGAIVDGGGQLALTKTGSGTLTLAGTNTYIGDTTVNAGKLLTTTASTGGGNYMVADTATLGVNVVTNGGTLNMITLTLGSSSLEFQNLNSTTTAAITAGSLNAPNALYVNVTSGTFAAGQDYPLITFSSGSPAPENFILASLPPGITATINATASPVVLHVTGVPNPNPTNIVTGVTNGVLTLQWPADHIGWLLQSNSVDLANTSAWFTVAGTINTNVVNIPMNPAIPHVYYRMRY